MPSTYDKIEAKTLGSATNSVTFTSIPATYTDLVIAMSVGATSGSGTGFGLRFNSDTGANYSDTRIDGDGSTATSARGTSQSRILQYSAVLPEASSTYGTFITNVFNYANTTTYKTTLTRSNNAAAAVQGLVGLWRNTSAINSLTFITFAGNFSIGSTFTLYGIKAA
jgi:hypothetical protein